MRLLPKGAWGEHGAWAIVLTSGAAGIIAARTLGVAPLLLLPSAVLLTAAKGLAQRARRTGVGYAAMAVLGLAGAMFALPAVVAAPLPFLAVAAAVGPFALLYLWQAGSPRWTRSLAVEVVGALLAASLAGLVVVAAHPGALMDGCLAWGAVATLFLPGVLRARLGKDAAWGLRAACLAAVLAGVTLALWLAISKHVAPWGACYAVLFLEDLYRIVRIPEWTTRRLGIVLTVKGALGALCVALAWHPFQ